MAAFNMLKFTQKFSSLNLNPSSCQPQRHFNMRPLLKKMGFPEKPKKPKSVFFVFKDSVKSDILKMNPSLKQTEIVKEASARWRKLTNEEKQTYKDMCAKSLEDYNNAVLKYENSLTDKQKLEIEEAKKNFQLIREARLKKLQKKKHFEEFNRPKKPMTPYMKVLISIQNSSNKTQKIEDAAKKAGENWKSLPQNVKDKYTKEYEKELKEYHRKLEEWEDEMMELGHTDLVRAKTLRKKYKH